VRGGLDDALEKLARRDELRRRATSEATGTPAAVTELVEAIAAVVARNPRLGVTVGVEGEGDPMVLRFFYDEGQVQVTADNTLAAQATDDAPRHADFDVVVGEPVEEFPPAYPNGETQRLNQEGFGSVGYSYDQPAYFADPDTAERRYGSFEGPPSEYSAPEVGEDSRDLGARMRNLGMASSGGEPEPPFAGPPQSFPEPQPTFREPQQSFPEPQQSFREPQQSFPEPQQSFREPQPVFREAQTPEYPPHPLAPTPPPSIPPQTTRRIEPEQYRAPAEPAAHERMHPEWAGATERIIPPPVPEQRGMPTPLPQPIPLQIERPEQTEIAARRLAALLRDDPSLLNQRPE
jgi:hypothetical protein